MSTPPRGQPPPHLPSVHPTPTYFPQAPPGNQAPGTQFAERKQMGPLFKMAKHLMKLPSKKVLQKRNTPVRKKFRVL